MTTDTVGGVWTYAIELARSLAPHGVRVALATMGAPLTSDQRRAAESVPGLTVHESRYKLEWMHDPWEDVERAGDWLMGLERRLRPDLVHLSGYAHGALGWRTPTLMVAHSCVLTWWKAVKGCEAPEEWARYREAVSRGLHAAGLVVAPSRAMLTALLETYGPVERSRVIYNGRSPNGLAPVPKENLVLTAGRLWDEAKNVSALAAAAREIPWPVYIAGEDQHPDGGCARHDDVHLLGRLAPEALAPWFTRAAIYALPARYEPFGLTALEAALAGCALVLGDIPSLREIWADAAVYVPPEDAAALAAAIRALVDDPDRRAGLAGAARKRAARYTPEAMAQGYLEAYRELVGPAEALVAAGGAGTGEEETP